MLKYKNIKFKGSLPCDCLINWLNFITQADENRDKTPDLNRN